MHTSSSLLNPWARVFVALLQQDQTEHALRYLVQMSESVKKTRAFEQLSLDLDNLDVTQVPTLGLVALLRNTQSFRHSLPAWEALFSRTYLLLASRHEQPALLLRGLL
jgi:hypothetical protein